MWLLFSGGALLFVAGGGGGGGKRVEALIVVDSATLPERHEVVIAPKHLCIACIAQAAAVAAAKTISKSI